MPESTLNKNIGPVFSILTSTVIWMVLLFVIPLNVDINWPQEFWIKQSIFLFILILFYNANTYLFVQRLLFKDKLWFYIIVVVISVAAILVTMQVIEHSLNLRELMHKAIRPNKPYEPKVEWFRFDFFALLISLLVFGLSTSISLFRKGQKDALIRNELEKQKVSSELSFLKAQINPHFYFNTLNNIYALTGINANSAKEAIHKLSKMMRYVLYETEKEKTLLSQEISFIENYIEIMKLRLTEKVKVILEKPENIGTASIAPMIMLPFIENAFKHGVSAHEKSEIKITVAKNDNHLLLTVKNDIFNKQGMDLEAQSGIGLTNTRRRLELLYPGQHNLVINDDKETFEVSLDLTLI